MKYYYFLKIFLIIFTQITFTFGSKYADQLFEDLMYYYNKNVRPVANSSQALKVKFGASLIRIIDVVSCFRGFPINFKSFPGRSQSSFNNKFMAWNGLCFFVCFYLIEAKSFSNGSITNWNGIHQSLII